MADLSFTPSQDFDYEHNPTWRIFRIMSEFVDGFSFLARIQRSVTFFGSARLKESNPYYQQARDLAHHLAERGYTVVTGGGPGIMQAANQGATEAGGESVGLNIQLPTEQRINRYVKRGMSFSFFFSRKVMLNFSAEAFIFFPGGYGTLDEFFELITLVQTGKHERSVPIVMVGRAYWEPLTRWMQSELQDHLHTIDPKDLDILTLTDDLDEVVRIVETGVEAQAQEWLKQKGRARKTLDDRLKQATSPMEDTEQ
jgi:uncharacterized protein (TIGR00730 family)